MTDQANRPVAEITGDLDRLCIDTIRTLSMGAVHHVIEAAKDQLARWRRE